MAPKKRMRRLAVLVNSPTRTLTEVLKDILRETVGELESHHPRVYGRIARDLRRRHKSTPGALVARVGSNGR